MREQVNKVIDKETKPWESNEAVKKALYKIKSDGHALEHAKLLLSKLMDESPVEVYAIALDLLRHPCNPPLLLADQVVEEIARSAARNSLRSPRLAEWNDEMIFIESGDYARFTSYHFRCGIRLLAFLATRKLIERTGDEWVWYNTACGVCPLSTGSLKSPGPVLAPVIAKPVATWWGEYWRLIIAATGERPCEETVKSDKFWTPTLQALAKRCPTCHTRATEEYPRFKKKVLEIMTSIINEVRIHLSTDLPTKSLIPIQ